MKLIRNIDQRQAILAIILAAVIFTGHLFWALGVVGDVAYVAVVFLTISTSRTKDTVIIGIVCSVLIAIGYFWSPHYGALGGVVNHALAILGIWVAVFFVLRYKRSQKGLLSSQQRFSKVFQSAPIAMSITSFQDGKFIDINEKYSELLGYKKGKLIGHTVTGLGILEKPEERKQILDLLQEKGSIHEIGLKIRTKGGETKDMLASIEKIELNGEDCNVTMLRDITSKKKMKKLLSEEKETAQRYLDMAGVILVVVNRNQEVVLINQKGCAILGYEEHEIIGKNWFDNFLPADLKEKSKSIFDLIMECKRVPTEYYEHPVLTKNGEERLIAWHNTVIKGKNGKVITALSSGEDITLRKKAEAGLTGLERNLRSLHEITSDTEMDLDEKVSKLLQLGCEEFNLPIGILSKIDGNEYKVKHIEGPEEVLKVISKGDLFKLDDTFCATVLTRTCALCIENVSKSQWHSHPCYQQFKLEAFIGIPVIINNDIYGTINFSSIEPREVSFTSTDKEVLNLLAEWVGGEIQRQDMRDRLHTLNLDLENKVEKRTGELEEALRELQGVNDSLEEEVRKRKDAETKAKTALENERELGELKSRFVSMASHEFRTPLSGVLTSASLIERYNGPEQKEKRSRHIGIIKESVGNLTGILNDFLSLEKLETRKIKSNPALFDIDEFVRETIIEIEHILKHGQQINYKNDLKKPEVYLDQHLLKPVLNNLINNALKYSPEGMPIELAIKSTDAEIAIEVQDWGIGIPEKDKQHIFQRFFRAGNATNISGTGLGLNITKKHIELMGGSITFKSKQDVGTTFIAKLPNLFEKSRTHLTSIIES